jgi:hypothetical protein
MGQLMVRCRFCGGLYPSGVIVDKRTFEASGKLVYGIKSKCPFCHTENKSGNCELVCPA